jgi:hypothetical protein
MWSLVLGELIDLNSSLFDVYQDDAMDYIRKYFEDRCIDDHIKYIVE